MVANAGMGSPTPFLESELTLPFEPCVVVTDICMQLLERLSTK